MPTRSPVATAGPVAVPLKEVERELGRQYLASRGEDDVPPLRAWMSNLVVYCDKAALAEQVAALLPDIVSAHPSRVLLLIGEGGEDDGDVVATVQVETRRAGRLTVSSETITLRARPGAVERLPFAARPLLLGDIPTNLWWATPQPPPLAGTLLYNLSEYAQQLIYDSQGWQDPHRGVAATAAWLERFERANKAHWRVASDLNWRRLKSWRRILTQVLDASCGCDTETIRGVVVEHGPHAVTQAWALLAWLAYRRGWRVQEARVEPGVEMAFRVASQTGDLTLHVRRLPEGPPEVRKVILTTKDQPLTIVVEDERRLTILGDHGTVDRTVTIQRPTLAELVARQLSDREPDPVFRESMAVAQVFAQSVL